jgi:uncharacterized membrane protein
MNSPDRGIQRSHTDSHNGAKVVAPFDELQTKENFVSNMTQTRFAKRGTIYLLLLGAVGLLFAVFLAVTAFAEIQMGRFSSGLSSLTFGALYGAASIRAITLGREARDAIKRRLGGLQV